MLRFSEPSPSQTARVSGIPTLFGDQESQRGSQAGPRSLWVPPTYFARAREPTAPGDLSAHEAVIYDQGGGGEDWTFRGDNAEIAVTLRGRLRVSAAEGVRAAVLANAGIAIASEWMFAPEIKDGTVKVVLQDWSLPPIDLWAVFPAGRTTAKARIFTQFVQELMRVPSGTAGSGGGCGGR